MEYYSQHEEIQLVNDVINKPTAFSGRVYPVEYLGDREFEVLIYLLFKAEIAAGIYGTSYDTISLMKGVAERGRDSILLKDRKNCGVVQCKKYASLITKPDLCREVIKFLLHLIQDPSLIDSSYTITSFDYYLVSVKGLNEVAQELTNDFNKKILLEEKLKLWTEEVIENNKSILFKNYEEVKDKLHNLLSAINVNFLSGVDLDSKLKKHKDVVSVFFEVEKVASEQMVREVLNEFNVKGINDEELKRLITNLESVPNEKRLLFGFINFYGFNIDFLRKLWADGNLKTMMYSIVNVRTEIDKHFIDFLQDKIKTFHLIFFADSKQIHPFTKQAVVPYLFSKYALRYQRSQLGNFMAEKFEEYNSEKDFSIHSVNTFARIKKQVLQQGEKFLKKDFSDLEGDEELKRYKISLMEFIHSGLNSVNEMSARFDEDMQKIKPMLPSMEIEIEKLLPVNPTIVIETANLFDDPKELLKVMSESEKLK